MAKASKLRRNNRTERQKQKKAAQPARTIINKKRKLLKHIVKQPNDLQAQKAL